MTSGPPASDAPYKRVVFAVQRSTRLLLPLLIGLSVGCAGTRDSPKYTWLRKQGPVQATDRPANLAANVPSKQSRSGQKLEPLSISNFKNASPGHLQDSLNSLTSDVTADALIGLSYSGPQTLPNTAQKDTAYYDPEPRRWNVKAISALPIGLAAVIIGIASQSIYLLLIGGAIAFALGLIGSRQCRDRQDRGKGFAIAGMALGAAALFFSLMVLILAA